MAPGSSVMGFSRQGYWRGLPCPPPGDLPDPGIKSESPASPALQADSFPASHQWGSRLVKKQSSGKFQNGFFSPPPTGNTREFFSALYCGKLVELLGVISQYCGGPAVTGSLGDFNSQGVIWVICQLRFHFFLALHCCSGSHSSLPSWAGNLCICLSNPSSLGESVFSCVLFSLEDPKRVANF